MIYMILHEHLLPMMSKYFVIHNIPAQRELVSTIMEHWKSGFGSTYNPDRKDAYRRGIGKLNCGSGANN